MVWRALLSIVALAGCEYSPAAAQPDGEPDDGQALDSSDPPPPDTLPTAGLIAYYPLDDLGTGAQAVDATGNSHTGTCASCPTVGAGRIGNAFVFRNATSRIDVMHDAAFATGAFSIAAWVQFDFFPGSGFACPFSKQLGTGVQNSWQLCVQAGPTWMYGTPAPGGNVDLLNASTPTPIAATWFHVALTFDGLVKRMWVAGVEVASRQVEIQFDNRRITFGADIDNNTQSAVFTGLLDDLRIYDRALTAAELAALAAL